MGIVWLVVFLLLLSFSFVLLFGAPYLPTLKRQIQTSLDLLDLAPGQRLLELGSGDGRVLLAAARRGHTAVGYELNPILVLISRIRLFRYRRTVTVMWGNYWSATWEPTDAIFFFGLQKFMEKLDKKITQECRKPVKLVSFGFRFASRHPALSKDGVYLYVYR